MNTGDDSLDGRYASSLVGSKQSRGIDSTSLDGGRDRDSGSSKGWHISGLCEKIKKLEKSSL